MNNDLLSDEELEQRFAELADRPVEKAPAYLRTRIMANLAETNADAHKHSWLIAFNWRTAFATAAPLVLCFSLGFSVGFTTEDSSTYELDDLLYAEAWLAGSPFEGTPRTVGPDKSPDESPSEN